MEIQSTGYKEILKSEYQIRLNKNGRYSLNAYARDLSLTPQMLSDVLKNKKDLSIDSAAEVVNRLCLDPNQAENFIDGVILSSCKSEMAKKMVRQRIEDRNQVAEGFRPLTLEMFKVISDWYHLAILELIKCEGFKSDSRWIATKLGITAYEVKEAVSRLKALELLDEENGQLKLTELSVSALSSVPSAALREHAKQILTKGIAALEEQCQDERDITSMTMAIDPALLPEAKKMIMQFRRKLCRFLESGKGTEVYVFSQALFRLSKKERKNI
ncbi:MAG: DUF4423 domain-containing protein [Bacteriovoracaceae bacterium]